MIKIVDEFIEEISKIRLSIDDSEKSCIMAISFLKKYSSKGNFRNIKVKDLVTRLLVEIDSVVFVNWFSTMCRIILILDFYVSIILKRKPTQGGL